MVNKKLLLKKMKTSRFLRRIATFLIILSLTGCLLRNHNSPYKYTPDILVVNSQPCFYVGPIHIYDDDSRRNKWNVKVIFYDRETLKAFGGLIEHKVWEIKKIKAADSQESCIGYDQEAKHNESRLPLKDLHPYLVVFYTKTRMFGMGSFCTSHDANNQLILLETAFINDNSEEICTDKILGIQEIK